MHTVLSCFFSQLFWAIKCTVCSFHIECIHFLIRKSRSTVCLLANREHCLSDSRSTILEPLAFTAHVIRNISIPTHRFPNVSVQLGLGDMKVPVGNQRREEGQNISRLSWWYYWKGAHGCPNRQKFSLSTFYSFTSTRKIWMLSSLSDWPPPWSMMPWHLHQSQKVCKHVLTY